MKDLSLSKRASLQYRVVYDAKSRASHQRALIIEEPPVRRILSWYYDRKGAEIDLPIPWVYTYLRMVRNRKLIWSLWDTRVFFSTVQLDDPTINDLSPAYVSNVGRHGEVCWGNLGFEYELQGRVDKFVPYCLNNFWFRRFNAEITPSGAYTQALKQACGTTQASIGLFRKASLLSVEEVLALPVHPDVVIANIAWIPKSAHEKTYALSDTYRAARQANDIARVREQ